MNEQKPDDGRWSGFVTFIIIAVLVMVYLIGNEWGFDWRRMATMSYWAGEDGGAAGIFSNLLGPIVTALAAMAAYYYATQVRAGNALVQEQIGVARQGQYAERFAKAAAMLSDQSLPVREAGIYALRELAIADPEGHYFPVQDLLCSFMRDAGRYTKANLETVSFEISCNTNARQKRLRANACTSDISSALRAFSDLRTPKNLENELKRKWKPDLKGAHFIEFAGHSNAIDLSNAMLHHANFYMANLTSAVICNSTLENTNFELASLTNAEFTNSNLSRANLTEAKVGAANFTNAALCEALLINCTLDSTNFARSICYKARFTKSKFINTEFYMTDLRCADFTNTEVDKIDFSKANLRNTNFSQSRIVDTKFIDTSITESVFDNANIRSTEFDDSSMISSNFRRTRLTMVSFKKCRLNNCAFQDASFYTVSFRGAEIRLASFANCNLLDTDMPDADIWRSTFEGCTLRPPLWPRTKWPENCSPSAIVADDNGVQYFTFVPIEEASNVDGS